MTPKEKAEELFSYYNSILINEIRHAAARNYAAYECALIAVNEILENMMLFEEPFDAGLKIHHRYFWEEVKQEIEKL